MEKFKNSITITLISVLVCLLSVTNLNAQGPTSPEAASFEPVDASDMVNLLTGDFSYVLPLLTVPSPEGGYPLALSYHGGVAMEQEASWVGLGWSLNPGAINRSVNGYADDWKKGLKADMIYDIGGEYTGYNFGVSVGIGGKYGMSIGLYATYSQNKAFGGETTHGFDVGATAGSQLFNVNARLGTDGVGIGAREGIFNVGINQSFKGGGTSISGGASIAGTGISLNSQSGFGASVYGASINLGGSSSLSNNLSFSNTNIQGSIPVFGININFGYQKSRYWLFDRSTREAYGILHFGSLNQAFNDEIIRGLINTDSYESIYEADQSAQMAKNNFAFASYDSYSVSGQGVGGTMTPNLYEIGSLKLKSQKTNNGDGRTGSYYDFDFSKSIDNPNNDIFFYFDNTNASYLETSIASINSPGSSLSSLTNINFSGEILDASTNIDGVNYNNYNTAKKRKTNGNYVETYTNKEILENPNSIIEAKNFTRPNNLQLNDFLFDYESGIGAYKIVAMDGKTYHYSLPVYQKEQFTRTAEKNDNINEKFYEEQTLSPYATHWLLTAITGPDYIDVNNNNQLDESDYGYWIEFQYGKWSDDYVWRSPTNPNEYFENDQSKSYSMGVKEVYYLDKVKTRTHTALFVKEDRNDNQSYAVNASSQFNATDRSYILGTNGDLYVTSEYGDFSGGGFDPSIISQFIPRVYYKSNFNANKHKSLRLNKILILENSKIPSELTVSNNVQLNSSFEGNLFMGSYLNFYNILNGIENEVRRKVYPLPTSQTGRRLFGEYYESVLDIEDLNTLSNNIEDDALKVIEFNFDETYPLAKNSPNSTANTLGKLTLQKVEVKGKSAAAITPPYVFKYNNSEYSYNYNLMDDWGYYKDKPEVWSLSEITTPTGARINVEYESDDYSSEVAFPKRIWSDGLKFKFENINGLRCHEVHDSPFLQSLNGPTTGNVKLTIYKDEDAESSSEYNFQDYFDFDTPVLLDIWASKQRNYVGSGWRGAGIDVNMKNGQIISISDDEMVLEVEAEIINWSDQTKGDHLEGVNEAFGELYEKSNSQNKSRYDLAGCSEPCWARSIIFRVFANKLPGLAIPGGGVRVKSVSLYDGNQTYTKEYEYEMENSNSSSGVTSYAPAKYNKEIKYLTELPSPYVMYSRVGVKNTSSQETSDETTYYYFNTLDPEQNIYSESQTAIGGALTVNITQDVTNSNVIVNGENSTVTRRKYDVINSLSSLGRLEKKVTFNKYKQILSKTENTYKELSEIKQGISRETFKTFKRSDDDINGIVNHVTIASKISYPSVLKSSTTTQNGFSTTTHYDRHDFNTGQLLESHMQDSKGITMKTSKVPAYTKYVEMGSMVDDVNNKNMLTQNSGSYSYIVDNNVDKITSASVTTWDNNWTYREHDGSENSPTSLNEKIWRQKSNYVWEGDINENGVLQGFTPFNYNSNSQVNEWKKASEITRYDHFSTPLETKDINGNFAASRLVDGSSKVSVSGNAKLSEMYYSGAEYVFNNSTFEGEVLGANFRTNVDAHTGEWCVKNDAPNDKVFQVLASVNANGNADLRPGKYRVSFWTKPLNDNNDDGTRLYLNGVEQNPLETISADCWKLYNYLIEITNSMSQADVYVTNNIIAGNSFDDFRMHPVYATVTSYVYDKDTDLVIAILDNNNLATKYCYDAAGRLCTTYNEIIEDDLQAGGFKIASKNAYNYKDFEASNTDCECLLNPCNGNDIDGDGIINSEDNCPTVYNPDQLDADNDGIGDACDNDADNDGIPDDTDTCPNHYDPTNADNDNDGIGDVCDPDDDNDGILDENDPIHGSDNCQFTPNTDQSDVDSDGIGDVCDFQEPDDDGDGIANIYDTCINIPNAYDNMNWETEDGINTTCDENTYPPPPDYSGLQNNFLSEDLKMCDENFGQPMSSSAVLYPSNGSTVNPVTSFKIIFNTENVGGAQGINSFNRRINIIRASDNTIIKTLIVDEAQVQNGSTIFNFGLLEFEENETYTVEVSNQAFWWQEIFPYCLDTTWQFNTSTFNQPTTETVQFKNKHYSDFDRGASFAMMGDYSDLVANPFEVFEYFGAHVIGNNRHGEGSNPQTDNPFHDDSYFGRAFLNFNTEAIPDNAVITSVKLKLQISESGPAEGIKLIVHQGYQQPEVPHTYLHEAQFRSFGQTIIGDYDVSSNISDWVEIEIPITSPEGVINVKGLSKLCLREMNDYDYAQNPVYPVDMYVKTWISNIVGTGQGEYIKTERLPILEVEYEIQ